MADRAPDDVCVEDQTRVVLAACEYLGLTADGPSLQVAADASGVPLRAVVEHLAALWGGTTGDLAGLPGAGRPRPGDEDPR